MPPKRKNRGATPPPPSKVAKKTEAADKAAAPVEDAAEGKAPPAKSSGRATRPSSRGSGAQSADPPVPAANDGAGKPEGLSAAEAAAAGATAAAAAAAEAAEAAAKKQRVEQAAKFQAQIDEIEKERATLADNTHPEVRFSPPSPNDGSRYKCTPACSVRLLFPYPFSLTTFCFFSASTPPPTHLLSPQPDHRAERRAAEDVRPAHGGGGEVPGPAD